MKELPQVNYFLCLFLKRMPFVEPEDTSLYRRPLPPLICDMVIPPVRHQLLASRIRHSSTISVTARDRRVFRSFAPSPGRFSLAEQSSAVTVIF
jgi:hypothetical protein